MPIVRSPAWSGAAIRACAPLRAARLVRRRRDDELACLAVVQQDAARLGAGRLRRIGGGAAQEIVEVEKCGEGGIGTRREPPCELRIGHAGILPLCPSGGDSK